MNKGVNWCVQVICVGMFLVFGVLSYYHYATETAAKRKLSSHEFSLLDAALKDICIIDPHQCAAIKQWHVEYFVLDKSWFAHQLDLLQASFGYYGGLAEPIEDGFSITLVQTIIEAPAELRVVLYHEHAHVLFSDTSVYASSDMRNSWDQCIDHNYVKEATRKIFSDFAIQEASSLAASMKTYADSSHGNSVEACEGLPKLDDAVRG